MTRAEFITRLRRGPLGRPDTLAPGVAGRGGAALSGPWGETRSGGEGGGPGPQVAVARKDNFEGG